MEYTYSDELISDLHKDAYGHRPSEQFWLRWNAYSKDDRQATWDYLCERNEIEAAFEREMEEECNRLFDRRIEDLKALGARDFDMAVRWLHEAYDTANDDAWLEWHFGMAYGYINQCRRALAL